MRWRRPELWIPLLAIVLRVIPGPRVIDDAYIIFRYAQNLLDGKGLVFNPGEPVFGITTPLFVLLLAGAAFPIGGTAAPFPALALGVSALADAATCFLLIRLGRTLDRPPAGILTALVWAVAPMSVTFAIGGMETSVFVLLTTATLYFHSTHRPTAAALCAGLSLTTRPDALVMIGFLVLERGRQTWKARRGDTTFTPIRAMEIGAFLAPVILWGIFAWSSYGTPIPNSLAAKTSAYHLPPEAATVRLLQHFSTPFLEHLVFGTAWIAIGLILYSVLYLLGALDTVKPRAETWPLFAYAPAYFLAFSIANPLIFRWYLTPPLPMFFFGIFLGAQRLARDLRRPFVVWAFGAAAVLLSLHGWSLRPESGPTRPAPEMAFVGLENLYETLGRRLRTMVGPNEVVAAGDIGALGFTSGARILDMVGLVSPQVIPFYPLDQTAYVINFAVSSEAIDRFRPDYVVILEVYGRETVLKDPQFLHAYALVETVPTDLYGSDGLLVFHRMKPQ
ncbi:MAG TPA: hypothetical protein VJ160_04670 [Anaerolineales bacterium]|nr:hypothetical protein [Anaerolineales bacterium]